MQLVAHHNSVEVPLWSGGSEGPIVSRLGRSRAVVMSAEGKPTNDPGRWSRLIEAVAITQDRAAFAALFEHFAPRVKTFMLRSGANEASAEEVAQETMLSVWRKAAMFDPASIGAAAWIFTIARNLRIDALRREQRGGLREAELDLEQQVDDLPTPDSQFAAAQSEQRVRAAIAQLSDEQMRVVELSFFEEKAHAEIAQQLQIPLGTVKSRLRLAMARLRTLLGDLS
jgi:RNA polymerase sigma-70 factor (ECF subfamily)